MAKHKFEDAEFTLFSRDAQNVAYRPQQRQPDVFDYGVTEMVYLLFEPGKWYRVAYRRDMEMESPELGRHTAEFIFLEHPDHPGLAIGFRRDTFF